MNNPKKYGDGDPLDDSDDEEVRNEKFEDNE